MQRKDSAKAGTSYNHLSRDKEPSKGYKNSKQSNDIYLTIID